MLSIQIYEQGVGGSGGVVGVLGLWGGGGDLQFLFKPPQAGSGCGVGVGRKGSLHLYKKEISLAQLTHFDNFVNLLFLQLTVFGLVIKIFYNNTMSIFWIINQDG